MVVNHLQTSQYHLGLACSHCMEYFTMSANSMCWHSQLHKPVPASIDNDNDNDNQEEESVNNDNSREYKDELAFYED